MSGAVAVSERAGQETAVIARSCAGCSVGCRVTTRNLRVCLGRGGSPPPCWRAADGDAVLERFDGGQTPGPVLALEAAFERALRANPTVEAARRRQIVATEAIGVASGRPNPDLRVEFERETPTPAYTLAVPIATSGRHGRRIDLAAPASR